MDHHGIAQRIRELTHVRDSVTLAEAALELRVDEMSLRASIDDVAPCPTAEVLAAVLQHFAVDPTWLLTGEYSSSTHLDALTAAALPDLEATRQLLEILARPSILKTPPSLPNISPEGIEQ